MSDKQKGIADTYTISVCPFCNEKDLKCSLCGNQIFPGAEVECLDGLRHICDICLEG